MTASTWTFVTGIILTVFGLGVVFAVLWSTSRPHNRANLILGSFFMAVALAAMIDLVHIQSRLQELRDSIEAAADCNASVTLALRERFGPRAAVDLAGLQRDQAVAAMLREMRNGTLQGPAAAATIDDVEAKLATSIKAYEAAQRVFAIPIPGCDLAIH